MKRLYSIFIFLAEKLLPFFVWADPKLNLFVQGRKNVFAELKTAFQKTDQIFWFHAASLGEYEQGVPVMKAVKNAFPDHKILVTFFSPSGYEVRKNNKLADLTVYLPLDTKKNAKKFVERVRPRIAFFIKYEVWPNYLQELENHGIKTLLISGLFRKNQIYFKLYGGFMVEALKKFDHFFVQNEESKTLLEKFGMKNITISGDTRFDRVSHQIETDNSLGFMERFKNENLCMVCGSTWPEDETVLLTHINDPAIKTKFVIAPHEINHREIESLRKKIQKKTLLYSELENKNLSQVEVLILDTVGLLTKVYSYADIAYVGGAMGNSGLHNILEPAAFGVPIIVGKNIEKFPEAKKLQRLAGLFTVKSSQEFNQIMYKLTQNPDFRKKTGMISEHFIDHNTGATAKIIQHLTT